MKKLLNLLSDFVYHYDLQIIALFAFVCLVVFFLCKNCLKNGNKILNPSGNMRFKTYADSKLDGETAKKLQYSKTMVLITYSIYANITAIFPLLGILGTVAALIYKSEEGDMMQNLMVALDTTLLGVFCAIVAKIFDPLLSGKVEVFVDDADYVLRHTEIPEGEDAK